jgi:FixJ family two-component response regulator
MRDHRAVVAVVDDEDIVRRALGRFFRAAGLEVEFFSSGDEFLDHVTRRPPDCAVVDLHLPGLNGHQVLERLRGLGTEVPVLIVTGKYDSESETLALQGGALAYLRKPLDGDALLSTVLSAVERKASNARSGV